MKNSHQDSILDMPLVAKKSSRRARALRILSFACLLCIFAGMLAACGGSSQGSTDANGNITITVMDHWTTEPASSEMNKLFAEYHKLHPNITIKRDSVPIGSMLAKADQEAATHTLPNLLILDNPDLPSFASTGALAPLDSFLTGNLAPSNFFGGSLSEMTYNGKYYAVPTGSNDLALFYNKKMFQDAHLTPPTTWGELKSDAKKLTSGDTYGFAFSSIASEEGSWQFEPFLWSNNGDLTKVNNPQGVQALQMITDMVKAGSVSKAALNWNQAAVTAQFKAGHAAMMENGPWNLKLLSDHSVDYGIVPFPTPTAKAKPVSPLGGEVYTIPVTTTDGQKAAEDLVQWLMQPTQLLDFDKTNGYIPPLKSIAQQMMSSNTDLKVFSDELNTARARTSQVGAKYPRVSQALWSAEQSALAGSQSPKAAMDQAQQTIDSVLGK